MGIPEYQEKKIVDLWSENMLIGGIFCQRAYQGGSNRLRQERQLISHTARKRIPQTWSLDFRDDENGAATGLSVIDDYI